MAKLRYSKEVLYRKTELYRNVLSEKFADEFVLDEKDNELLIHKKSKLPRRFILFISMHPKVDKLIIGVKSQDKVIKEKIVEVYDNLPLDLKGRMHNAIKYSCASTEMKFKAIEIDENILKSVENLVTLYKESFKEFLN